MLVQDTSRNVERRSLASGLSARRPGCAALTRRAAGSLSPPEIARSLLGLVLANALQRGATVRVASSRRYERRLARAGERRIDAAH